LVIRKSEKTVYDKRLQLHTLQSFQDSFKFDGTPGDLVITLGNQKLRYEGGPSANMLSRPVESRLTLTGTALMACTLKERKM
jgi:hypothetical protein